MALHLDPHDHLPAPRERKVRAADIRHEWKVGRNGIEVIGHGALICPSCEAPIVVATTIPAASWLRCGFCDHRARAREYLVRDVFDTVANEAYMVARLT